MTSRRASVSLGLALLAAAIGRGAGTPAVRLTLASPLDFQVFQRRSATEGAIVIEGAWAVPRHAPPPGGLDYALAGPGEADFGPWRPLPFDPRARGFCAEIPVAPGGWYRVEVRAVQGGQTAAWIDVGHVGVGEVFVIAGQSNSANYADVRERTQTGRVAAFDGQHWALAADPEPGATGTKGSFIPIFGDLLVQRLKVPVGVVCLGVGSTSVREWMPRGTAMTRPPTTGAHTLVLAGDRFISTGELFDRLAAALRRWPAGRVRAVLWHQGESDWNQEPGHAISIAEYRSDLAGLIADSRRAAGWDVPWVVAEASYHSPADRGSAEFRAAQHSVVDGRLTFAGPDTDVLGPEYRNEDGRGVHLNAAGQRRHAELWAEAVAPLIEAGGASGR